MKQTENKMTDLEKKILQKLTNTSIHWSVKLRLVDSYKSRIRPDVYKMFIDLIWGFFVADFNPVRKTKEQ